jgi:hypothetical protein
LFTKSEEKPIVYDGKWSKSDVERWAKKEIIPTMFAFDEDFYEYAFDKSFPTIVLNYLPVDKNSQYVKAYKEAAKEYKGDVIFALTHGTEA